MIITAMQKNTEKTEIYKESCNGLFVDNCKNLGILLSYNLIYDYDINGLDYVNYHLYL